MGEESEILGRPRDIKGISVLVLSLLVSLIAMSVGIFHLMSEVVIPPFSRYRGCTDGFSHLAGNPPIKFDEALPYYVNFAILGLLYLLAFERTLRGRFPRTEYLLGISIWGAYLLPGHIVAGVRLGLMGAVFILSSLCFLAIEIFYGRLGSQARISLKEGLVAFFTYLLFVGFLAYLSASFSPFETSQASHHWPSMGEVLVVVLFFPIAIVSALLPFLAPAILLMISLVRKDPGRRILKRVKALAGEKKQRRAKGYQEIYLFAWTISLVFIFCLTGYETSLELLEAQSFSEISSYAKYGLLHLAFGFGILLPWFTLRCLSRIN